MIPIRDRLPTRSTPYLTWGLMVLNVFAFLYERAMLEAGYSRFLFDWGFIPARFVADPAGELITIATSMFLHEGWLHIASNMLFLWIFGDNVEDRLGKTRFLVFYFGAGIIAALAQMLGDPTSRIPMIGASGAIAGVLGGYALLYPRVRVVVLFPVFIFLQFIELPAWLVIAEWFAIQVLSGVYALGSHGSSNGGVAFFAHIGGFLAGFVFVRLLAPRLLPQEHVPYDPWRRRAWGPSEHQPPYSDRKEYW